MKELILDEEQRKAKKCIVDMFKMSLTDAVERSQENGLNPKYMYDVYTEAAIQIISDLTRLGAKLFGELKASKPTDEPIVKPKKEENKPN